MNIDLQTEQRKEFGTMATDQAMIRQVQQREDEFRENWYTLVDTFMGVCEEIVEIIEGYSFDLVPYRTRAVDHLMEGSIDGTIYDTLIKYMSDGDARYLMNDHYNEQKNYIKPGFNEFIEQCFQEASDSVITAYSQDYETADYTLSDIHPREIKYFTMMVISLRGEALQEHMTSVFGYMNAFRTPDDYLEIPLEARNYKQYKEDPDIAERYDAFLQEEMDERSEQTEMVKTLPAKISQNIADVHSELIALIDLDGKELLEISLNNL